MKIKVILYTILFFSFIASVQAFSFNFNFFGFKNSIKNYGTYRSWSNGSYAKSCNDYKQGVNGFYSGDIGDGIYRIKPDSNVEFDSYCDMNTDAYGWTLIFSGQTLSGSNYYNTSIIDKVLNGTASGSELKSLFTVMNSTISGQNLMKVVNRSTFEYIRFGLNNWMRSSQISTFATKNANYTSWSTHNCNAQFTNPSTNQIASFYDSDTASTQISKTKFGWNISLNGNFCAVSARLGCLVGLGDPTDPVDGISGVDYLIMGVRATNNCSPHVISGAPNGESYGNYYMVGGIAHRSINSYTLESMASS